MQFLVWERFSLCPFLTRILPICINALWNWFRLFSFFLSLQCIRISTLYYTRKNISYTRVVNFFYKFFYYKYFAVKKYLLLRLLLLTFILYETSLGEIGCLGNPYFIYWLPKHPVFWFTLTQSVRVPMVTYPSLCSTCVTYRILCHAIGHQVLLALTLT